MKPIVTVAAYCEKDKHLTQESLNWLFEMGFDKAGYGKGRKIVLAHNRRSTASGLTSVAGIMFDEVDEMEPSDEMEQGWPIACNHLWYRTAEHMAKQDCPWLYLEADAVVLSPDYLRKIELEYARLGKPFMGDVVRINDAGTEHLTGVSVYPPDAATRLQLNLQGEAWDYQCRRQILPMAADTKLIQQIWRRPPFMSQNDLVCIDTEAVIFHQCKDASLINLLRQIAAHKQPVNVAIDPETKLGIRKIMATEKRLRDILREFIVCRENQGKNPRVAMRRLDALIQQHRNEVL